MDQILKYIGKDDELEKEIKRLKIDEELKGTLLEYYEENDAKRDEWLREICKIPFGKYEGKKKGAKKIIEEGIKIMDKEVYGLNEVKEEILCYIGAYVNNNKINLRPIGLYSEPGLGKTTIVNNCFGKVLGRKCYKISLGGANGSEYLYGHDYTYKGSTYGEIVRALIETKSMNPIIFFDELDKVSKNNGGADIINLLIHLIDLSQNFNFRDKYFQGISIDLSKVIFVFAFNNITDISPILLDRLNILNIQPPSLDDKIKICSDYIIPSLKLEFPSLEKISFSNDILRFIISNYTDSSSLRPVKNHMLTIFLKLNLFKLYSPQSSLSSSKKSNSKNSTKSSTKSNKMSLSFSHLHFPTRSFVLNEDHIKSLLKQQSSKKLNPSISHLYL